MGEPKEREVRSKVVTKMQEAGLRECKGIIPRSIGKGGYGVREFGALVAYPVPPPLVSEELQLLQSKVHNMDAE